MKSPKLTFALTGAAVFLSVLPMLRAAENAPAAPPAEEQKVDPQSVELLRRAVDLLASAKQFSVTAELWIEEAGEDGLTNQFTKSLDIKLRRPDRLQVDVRTAVPRRSFYYDGKSLTLADHVNGTYGVIAAPPTIDETLTKVEQDFGVVLPIDDILLSKPFGNGAAQAKSSQVLPVEPVLGILCDHLSFRGEGVDWQVWIQQGPRPVIRKALMISTEAEEPGRVTALFRDWDFATELPDFIFTCTPPADFLKVEVLPAETAAPEAKPAGAAK